jgi:hypothetical protein
MKTLEEYLKENKDKAYLGHALKVNVIDKDGDVHIYIHPQSVDGDTLDFIVEGNNLIPKR